MSECAKCWLLFIAALYDPKQQNAIAKASKTSPSEQR
jgi:hypothetical protein